jgi:hypothetical protein
MTVAVVVPVQKDFRLFHDKIIQRGDIRFFSNFLKKNLDGKFADFGICSHLVNFSSSTVVQNFSLIDSQENMAFLFRYLV